MRTENTSILVNVHFHYVGTESVSSLYYQNPMTYRPPDSIIEHRLARAFPKAGYASWLAQQVSLTDSENSTLLPYPGRSLSDSLLVRIAR